MNATLLRFVRSEGVVLAAIPFLGSFAAFVFESGYLTFYDVPLGVIELGFIRVVISSIVVVIYILFAFATLSFLDDVTRGRNPVFLAMRRPAIVALSTYALLFTIPEPESRDRIHRFAILIFLTGFVWELLPPLFFARHGGTYLQRLKLRFISRNYAKYQTYELVPIPFPKDYRTYVIVGFIGTASLFSLGYDRAQSQTTHWVTTTAPPQILVEVYGDIYILRSYDPSEGKIGTGMSIGKLPETLSIFLRRTETGRLRPLQSEGGR